MTVEFCSTPGLVEIEWVPAVVLPLTGAAEKARLDPGNSNPNAVQLTAPVVVTVTVAAAPGVVISPYHTSMSSVGLSARSVLLVNVVHIGDVTPVMAPVVVEIALMPTTNVLPTLAVLVKMVPADPEAMVEEPVSPYWTGA
jgi:hypothetical protein